jgi:hypothetical protein
MNAGTSGANQLEATSTGSNILSVNNSAKITTLNSQTNITNENNIITATTSNVMTTSLGTNRIRNSFISGYNEMEASGTSTYNYLSATGTSAYNLIQNVGATGYNLIRSTGLNSYNQLVASGNNSYNGIQATGSSSFNSILASGAGGYNLMQTQAVNTGNYIDGESFNQLQINSATIMSMNSTITSFNNQVDCGIRDTRHFVEIDSNVVANASYIDFHANTTYVRDYDARLICFGTGTNANATGSISAECSAFNLTYLAGGGTRSISVNNAGTIIATPSDERLKENITPIDANSTHLKLLQLEPKNYEWIDKENMGIQTEIGLVAQDVMKIMPELTFQGQDEMYRVHYDRIPTLLLQSIKELQKQIDDLKSQITKMTTQGESLPSLDVSADVSD